MYSLRRCEGCKYPYRCPKNDPWIIDFGGSNTPGWVENDIAGTIEGDKQGLRDDNREVSKWLLSYSARILLRISARRFMRVEDFFDSGKFLT